MLTKINIMILHTRHHPVDCKDGADVHYHTNHDTENVATDVAEDGVVFVHHVFRVVLEDRATTV